MTDCPVSRDPEPYGDFWTDGEPSKNGYYLIRAERDGLPWIFFADVHVNCLRPGDVLYGDYYGASESWRAYTPGRPVAYAEPTGDNFERAVKEVQVRWARNRTALFGRPQDYWECSECGHVFHLYGPDKDERLGCDWCATKEAVVFVKENYIEPFHPCPHCGETWCVEHRQHAADCGCKTE